MAGNDRTLPDAKVALNNEAPINSVVYVEPYVDFGTEYYDMSKEKILVIFNHYEYFETIHFGNTKPLTREGTHKDVERLEIVFKKMGFKVDAYHDLFHSEILNQVNKLSTKDHSNTSCICIAILTHGDETGVYAADRPYQLSDVTNPLLEGHPTLVGKPKLFFVQACRGEKTDKGRVQFDGTSNAAYVTPTHADFLMLYSTVQDYLSYRDPRGSWLIQALCFIIEKYSNTLDISHIVTRVNRIVAGELTYNTTEKRIHEKKQMSEVRHTLRKLFKFEI